MNMRYLYLCIVCAAALMIVSAGSANAESLRMLNSWDASFPASSEIAQKFVDRVATKSGGAIQVTMDGPEVVAPFEQAEPVQAGVFQLLFSNAAYHTGITWAAYAMDSTYDPGPEKRREIGLWAALDEAYNAVGLKLIAIPSTGNGGYQFVTRAEPKKGDLPFSGLKIRGSPAYKPMIDVLGGALVVVTAGEMYAALDRGVVDGAGWPLSGFSATKLSEVVKYYYRPGFGSNNYVVLMNLEAWNALSAEKQEILVAAGAEIERETADRFVKLKEDEVEKMKAAGMQEVTLTEVAAGNMVRVHKADTRATALAKDPSTRKIIDIIEKNGL